MNHHYWGQLAGWRNSSRLNKFLFVCPSIPRLICGEMFIPPNRLIQPNPDPNLLKLTSAGLLSPPPGSESDYTNTIDTPYAVVVACRQNLQEAYSITTITPTFCSQTKTILLWLLCRCNSPMCLHVIPLYRN